MPDDTVLARLHFELIRGLIDHGRCPSTAELADRMGVGTEQIEAHLRDLESIHGVVLHPHVCEPWIVHPFSLTPTLNWIEGESGSWWAPCIWCALGVATVVGGKTRIHTRIGAESEPLIIDVQNGGATVTDDVWVHFAIPPARAWDNVHQHCALVLPFRSAAAIEDWCRRHGTPLGEAVPLQQVAHLAWVWYGSHASPDWHKWTISEAQEIFKQVGLTSSFWRLESRAGRF
jgi:hypothetical protein